MIIHEQRSESYYNGFLKSKRLKFPYEEQVLHYSIAMEFLCSEYLYKGRAPFEHSDSFTERQLAKMWSHCGVKRDLEFGVTNLGPVS